jgi:hypothetical protein
MAMKVRFESGGGVTGPAGNRSAAFDTEQMPAADAVELQSLVQAADFPVLSKSKVRTSTRPDEMYYEVTVAENDRTHTVSATHSDMPDKLRPLIAWLSAHAIPR